MKKILSLLIAAAAALNLGSCTNNGVHQGENNIPSGDSSEDGKEKVSAETPHDEVILEGRVAYSDENGVFFTYSDGDGRGNFCMLETNTARIYKADGTECKADLLVSGVPVSVEFDGTVLETYPEIIAPTVITIGDESEADNIVEMLLAAFDYLYESDSGLNESIKYLAFDLKDFHLITDGEKEAFIHIASSRCGAESLVGNIESLLEEGYIVNDGGFMSFPEGLLISFSSEDGETSDGEFEFEMSKYRSSLGAIFLGCRAKKSDGKWGFETESFAIS